MSRSQTSRNALSLFSSQSKYVCRSCRRDLSKRSFASAAAAPLETEDLIPPSQANLPQPETNAPPEPLHTISAGVLLSRQPLITPEPHPFEAAYHLYQRRLNERLVLPFTQYFYYKHNTPAYLHWRVRRLQRGGVATRDIGTYDAYEKEAWNDEVLVGNNDGSRDKIVRDLIDEEGRAAEFVSPGGDMEMAGLRRRTEADETFDEKSLERKLDRTLYLVVRKKDDKFWHFPRAPVEGKEGLKEAAVRTLEAACGPNMNTWFIANHPVGHLLDLGYPTKDTSKEPAPAPDTQLNRQAGVEVTPVSSLGEKVFFMKSRILAGQADLKDNTLGIDQYKWLAKDEVQKHVSPFYWSNVKHMLVEQ